MKIVVIGGTGQIGSKLVETLRRRGHMATPAAPRTGVDAVTGRGLAEALSGAEAVVDVSNSHSLEADEAMRFFDALGRRLLPAAQAAGVRRHVALSIVGTDRLQAIPYFRAKKHQEDLVRASGLPFSILRSTQFFEFIAGTVQDGSTRDVVISPARVQPISGVDVAEALADLATGEPLNGTAETAGPERFRMSDVAAEVLTAYEDPRCVVADRSARYFGALLDDLSLLPGPGARIGALRFQDWLRESLQPRHVSGPEQVGAPAGAA